MKINLPFINGKREKDIFKQTQRRLTFLYSGLLMLFLIIFIVIVYTLLHSVIFTDQERQLEKRVDKEARIIENYLSHNPRGNFNRIQALKDADQFFYYILAPSGQLVWGDEMIPAMREDILKSIQGWKMTDGETKEQTFTITDAQRKFMEENHEEADELHAHAKLPSEFRLMMAGHPIFYRGEVIGYVYMGKDVMFTYQLFNWFLKILLALAVLFLGVAFFISYFMSKRAMIPISKSFARQREFVADASHELRTPLSVLLSSINAMEMTIDTKEENMPNKLLLNMKNEVKRMTKLISSLLTLARSDSGTIEVKNEKVDLADIAKKTIQSVESLAKEKEINLTYTGPQVMALDGDQERFTQLFYILLDNAIKYTQNEGTVTLDLDETEQGTVINVKDTGIGISTEDQAKIFERFYRADKARTRQEGGHGLGLAIAKWIVEIHGGTMEVSSELGKGTTFTIKFPKTKRKLIQ